MSAEDDLAARVRRALAAKGSIREVKMFGGIGFMLDGNLVAAASRRGLLLRVGRERRDEALARSGVRPMEMRGRTMQDYVYVDPPGPGDGVLEAWLGEAAAFVGTLPPKASKAKPKPKPGKGRRT
jgi:hypothetical protein